MNITKSPFGQIDNQPVDLYSLDNGNGVIGIAKTIEYRRCIVGTAIVDIDNFVIHARAAHHVTEAAMELVDGPPPAGRAAEAWFFEVTEAGKAVMAARGAIKDADGPFPVWFYMAPGHR